MKSLKFLWFLTVTSVLGNAAGFEQVLMSSGKNIGRASASTSIVEGAEAIYFNPAGLATNANNELVVNAGYVQTKFKAPILVPNHSEDSKIGHNPIGSAFYSRNLNEKFTLGLGVFPSAGLKVEYNSINLGGGIEGTPGADLKVLEFSTGAAYKVTPKLSVGLAYRISYSTADFTALAPNPAFFEFKDTKGWDFLSFRGGVQYREEDWGLGFSVRTPVMINVKGKLAVKAGGPPARDNSAKIHTTLPLTLSIAGHCTFFKKVTAIFDYSFLNYKAADKLRIDSSIPGVPDVPLHWHNAHVFRVAAEGKIYDGAENDILLRTGYILLTRVTDPDTMLPSSEAPGTGHLFTVGTGVTLADNMEGNLALFYGFGEKKTNSTTAQPGTYRVEGLGFHAGFGWKF